MLIFRDSPSLSPKTGENNFISSPVGVWADENFGDSEVNSKDLRRAQNMEKKMKNQIKSLGEDR